MSDSSDRSFTFAAIAQAAQLVDDVAYGRLFEQRHVRPIVRGILETDPTSVVGVYGGFGNLDRGVGVAQSILSRPKPELVAVTSYLLGAIDLAERLRRQPQVVDRLRTELDRLRGAPHTEAKMLDDPPYDAISGIYQQTLSTLQRRIQVRGKPELLAQDGVAARVRTLLLGAVRSAWLWRQLGGRRWHLLLLRSNMRAALATVATDETRH
jgi:high frequency lysogenization protein